MSRSSFAAAIACVGAILLFISAGRAADAPGALQGQWTAVSASSRNQEIKGKELASVNLTIKADTLSFGKGGADDKMVIRAIDATKNPATIDLTINNGKESSLGLFKLDKDTLELCINSSFGAKASARPAAIGAGPDLMYIRYTRAK